MKEIIHTDSAPQPVGPYSQAIWAGDYLFCSGQISINPQTNEVFRGDVREQTRMTMENVRAVLEKAGLGFDHVVKTSIFLTDMGDFSAVNEIYTEYFDSSKPARSCVAVSQLPKDVNVEVEVIAFRG